MSQGPILIFDKSALQALNPDEANWLDNFFLTNITPIFYIETLADLEKAVHAGHTPEDIVGNLAVKTPDMQSSPAIHHTKLLGAELYGLETIVMDGRILRAGGRVVTLGRQEWRVLRKIERGGGVVSLARARISGSRKADRKSLAARTIECQL